MWCRWPGRPIAGEVVALLFSAGPTPGRFHFEIDDVELR